MAGNGKGQGASNANVGNGNADKGVKSDPTASPVASPALETATPSAPASPANANASNGNGQNLSIQVAQTNSAAKDDALSGENTAWLSEGGALSGSINVLANDPGSARLFAVHGALPAGGGLLASSASAIITVEHGGAQYEGTVSINVDGTVQIDLSSLSGNLALADGESLEVTFYYTAQMGRNGVLSTAAVTLTLTGTDTPGVISGDDTGAVQEDGTLLAAGTLTIVDPDAGQDAFADPASLAGTYGDFTFNPDTGEWGYTLRNGDANVQALNTGDTETDTLTVASLDGTSHDIVVSVEGADEPVELVNGSFEDGLTGFLTLGSAAAVTTSTLGGLSVNPTDGTQFLALSTDTDFGGTIATDAEIETLLGTTSGALDALGNGDAVEGSVAQTTFYLAAGSTLTFDYLFDTQDAAPNNDFAFLTLSPSTVEEIADVELVGDGGDTGWLTYSFTATDAGNYDLGVGVVDSGSSLGTSLFYIDWLAIF